MGYFSISLLALASLAFSIIEMYEDRKKKPALPNRLSPFVTPEDELEDRQETVEKAVMVYYRMLSNLLPKLARIKDPRKPGMVKHKMNVLLVYGNNVQKIWLGLYDRFKGRQSAQCMERDACIDEDQSGKPPQVPLGGNFHINFFSLASLIRFLSSIEPLHADTNVKSEYAAVSNVIKTYATIFDLGMVDDIEGTLAEMQDKLNKAGYEKVETEFRKQYEGFIQANVK